MIDFDGEQQEEVELQTLKGCAQKCVELEYECDFNECQNWINFKDDNNCDLVSIKKHGQLTLRQVGERLGVSYVRIKQIEDSAIKKIKNSISLEQLKN